MQQGTGLLSQSKTAFQGYQKQRLLRLRIAMTAAALLLPFFNTHPLAVGQYMRKRDLGGNYVTPYNLNCSLIRFDTPPACGGEVH